MVPGYGSFRPARTRELETVEIRNIINSLASVSLAEISIT